MITPVVIPTDVKALLYRRPDFTRLTDYINAPVIPFDVSAMRCPEGMLIWWSFDLGFCARAEWITHATTWN